MGSDSMFPPHSLINAVSIHAPTWGATVVVTQCPLQVVVSIHAPTWGATFKAFYLFFYALFQSTLPHGERLYFHVKAIVRIEFQSTLPHGERRYTLSDASMSRMFQSTLPHGERLLALVPMIREVQVSIHAPTWGATDDTASGEIGLLFQSTLPHGERLHRELL